MTSVGQISEFLDSFSPKSLAESWDNVGLIVGDRTAQVERIMTCLTVTATTGREAIERRAGMIVTHHPVLFRPVQRLTADDPNGRVLLSLIQAGVAVYSPHTSFDGTAGGINEKLAMRLGVKSSLPLRPASQSTHAKVVVFVPDKDLEVVSRAMFDAGAGVIGNYRECSFRVAGRGTFFGSEASNPSVGQAGRREQVDEWRLEVLCPHDAIAAVVSAMRTTHSYEEPAYDIYPLQPNSSTVGAGRYGDLEGQMTLAEFSIRVRAAIGAPLIHVIGSRDKLIRRIAVACGSGSDLLADAVAARCDVLVTGEASFHRQLEAESKGIALVLAGHYATERFAVEELAVKIEHAFAETKVWASETERDPSWISQ
jgi:dinuclear metal center YbgI/SA1388 family protein